MLLWLCPWRRTSASVLVLRSGSGRLSGGQRSAFSSGQSYTMTNHLKICPEAWWETLSGDSFLFLDKPSAGLPLWLSVPSNPSSYGRETRPTFCSLDRPIQSRKSNDAQSELWWNSSKVRNCHCGSLGYFGSSENLSQTPGITWLLVSTYQQSYLTGKWLQIAERNNPTPIHTHKHTH